MTRSLSVHFLPALTTPEELEDGSVVVIDVLRASTTITHALAAGAECVIPCLEVEEARQIAAEIVKDNGSQAVLGGERGGLRIAGFQLGNSPTEFNAETVAGRIVVFTTTNGTQAMRQCRLARQVLIGAFVNLSALCQALLLETPVHLLCAGTRGRITREDVLFAGAVVHKLTYSDGAAWDVNDQARIAHDAWKGTFPASDAAKLPTPAELTAQLRHTQGGRNLQGIGLAADIEQAADVDTFSVVPSLDVSQWKIGING